MHPPRELFVGQRVLAPRAFPGPIDKRIGGAYCVLHVDQRRVSGLGWSSFCRPVYTETIRVIEALGLSDADKEKIYRRNAERVLGAVVPA